MTKVEKQEILELTQGRVSEIIGKIQNLVKFRKMLSYVNSFHKFMEEIDIISSQIDVIHKFMYNPSGYLPTNLLVK